MSDGLLLNASGVTKRFGGLVAVNKVDFTIPDRSIVSLIGPNGAGKTTFFNIIAGIYDPTSGSIEFRGRQMIAHSRKTWLEPVIWVVPSAVLAVIAITTGTFGFFTPGVTLFGIASIALLVVSLIAAVARPPWYMTLLARFGIFRSARPNDMVAVGLGRTFQNIRLFHNMTALENVQVGMHTRLKTNWWDAMFSTPLDRREEVSSAEKAREYLALVGLKGRDEDLAKNLPYGDQRRLEVARALASEPALLLLDEPTAGMNPRETQSMMALINRLRSDFGLTVLLIEHDMRVVMGISDRVTVLDHGEKIAEGTPEEVRRNQDVIAAYLGQPAS